MRRDAPVIPLAPKRAASELGARSDDELMRLAAAGWLPAFSEIVRRHEPRLRGYCARVLGNRAHGDDVAQEVFLEVWRACARYEPRGQLRAYLFRAAHRRCLNELRARREATALDEAALFAEHDQVEALLAAERRQRLERLVAGLPPKLRDAIWLRYGADLGYDEIAAIARRPVETIRSRIFHGLKRLRQSVGATKERSGT
jgi:RNA polymerase sigma-70 factor (ECF subfamily)